MNTEKISYVVVPSVNQDFHLFSEPLKIEKLSKSLCLTENSLFGECDEGINVFVHF